MKTVMIIAMLDDNSLNPAPAPYGAYTLLGQGDSESSAMADAIAWNGGDELDADLDWKYVEVGEGPAKNEEKIMYLKSEYNVCSITAKGKKIQWLGVREVNYDQSGFCCCDIRKCHLRADTGTNDAPRCVRDEN